MIENWYLTMYIVPLAAKALLAFIALEIRWCNEDLKLDK